MGFIYFNPNPQQKVAEDCTIRAISLLTEQDWKQVYISLTLLGFEECDMPSSNAVWSKHLINLGYERKIIPNTCPFCYTVKDFCEDNPYGKFLLATGSHVVTVIDGNYFDAWDSGDQVPIYYWFKRED